VAAIDETIVARALDLLKPACFEWNVTKNELKYNKQLLTLLNLPETHLISFEEVVSSRYVADKDLIQKEYATITDLAKKLQSDTKGVDFIPRQQENVFRVINASGEVKWVKSSSTLFIDRVSDFRSGVTSPELKYICVIDSVESVWTKFKEEAQKEREHNHEGELEGIAEAIPHLVWATEPSGSVTYFNDRWTQYTGYSLENSGGWQWLYNSVHPEDIDRTNDTWNISTKTGQPYDIEYRLKCQNGSYRWFLGRGVPIKRADGTIMRWFGTCTDINDQKELEQRSRAAETHLRLVMSNIPVSLFTVDKNGTITFANDNKAFKEFNFSSSHVGQSSYDFIAAKGHDEFPSLVERALRGESFGTEVEYMAHVFSIHYSPLRNEQEEITGAAIVTNDITIQKEAENLAVREQSAIKVAQMKSEFLSTMSHEIRTPLNGIIGMSELLAETKLTEEQEKYLTIIQSSGSHLLTLINDILDYSKIDSGKLVLEMKDFNAIALLESSVTFFLQKFKSKELKVSLSVDQSLTDVTMTADEGRLAQILINLVSNAIKFTPANGSISVRVAPITKAETSMLQSDNKKLVLDNVMKGDHQPNHVDNDVIHATVTSSINHHVTDNAISKHEPLNVLFVVKDNGIGVSQEIQERLFSPFFQALGTNRKFGGTGLGLSICKKLSELMKGEIGVVSQEGEGSIFWFEIPIYARTAIQVDDAEQVPAHHVENSMHEELSAEKVPTTPRANVLVVEDHPVNQKLMILTLKKLGCQVTAVNNGLEALSVLYKDKKQFDIIYMDCHMPLLDGYATSKSIREHEKQDNERRVPIVALTAAALPGDREKCLESGMDDYITKPVTRNVLLASLKKWPFLS
jgi:PAS domain S-box-containing protein